MAGKFWKRFWQRLKLTLKWSLKSPFYSPLAELEPEKARKNLAKACQDWARQETHPSFQFFWREYGKLVEEEPKHGEQWFSAQLRNLLRKTVNYGFTPTQLKEMNRSFRLIESEGTWDGESESLS